MQNTNKANHNRPQKTWAGLGRAHASGVRYTSALIRLKLSYYILIIASASIYVGWYIAQPKLPIYVSSFVSTLLLVVSLLLAFLPGLFSALIVFLSFHKRSSNTKINISVIFLLALLMAFGNRSLFGFQHLEQFYLTLLLGFLSIKWVERNIGGYHAKEI